MRTVSGDVDRQGSSRPAARRRLKRAYIEEWAEDCVQALNEMFSGHGEVNDKPTHGPTVMQRCALRHILRSCAAMGKPPAELTCEGALDGLLANKCYQGQPVALAPLDVDLLSLPTAGSAPTDLATLVGGSGAAMVEEFVKSKVFPEEEAAERLRRSRVVKPYMDPGVARDRRKYADLLRRLDLSGMLCWRRSGKPSCGLFAVWKKASGGVRKQRLIVDCRRANETFGAPEPVRLATGQSLGSVEVDSGSEVQMPVYIGQVDIKDAFYNMLLPPCLQGAFCLPPVAAGRVGHSTVEGETVKGEELIFPVFRCVPMGWTHALWWCQVAHEKAAGAAHADVNDENKVSDRRVAPTLSGKSVAHTEYVDNFGVFSLDRARAAEVVAAVDGELQRRGWPMHPVEVTAGGDLLG